MVITTTATEKHQLFEQILDRVALGGRSLASSISTFLKTKVSNCFRRWKKTKKENVILELVFPAAAVKSAYATEQLYKMLWSMADQAGTEDKRGKESYALEIVSSGEEGIRYLAVVPRTKVAVARANLLAFLPGIKIREVEDYLARSKEAGSTTGIVELGLTGHFALPLTGQKTLTEHDPIGYLTGSMTQLAPSERVAFQAVVTAVTPSSHKAVINQANEIREKIIRGEAIDGIMQRRRWAVAPELKVISFIFGVLAEGLALSLRFGNSILITIRGQDSQVAEATTSLQEILNPYEQELQQRVKGKLDQPLFECSLRLLVSLTDESKRKSRTLGILAALGPLNKNYQSVAVRADGQWSEFKERALTKCRFLGENLILSAEELSDLYHFPYTTTTKTEDLVKVISLERPAPLSLKTDPNLEVIFGVNRYGEKTTKIGLSAEDRSRHVYILGQTGSGKSTILYQMARGDIEKGRGVAVVDPHGDLVDDLLGCIPEERLGDLIFLNPFDLGHPVAINLLELPEGLGGDQLDLEKELVCEGAVSVFRRIFQKEQETDAHRIEYILRNTIYTAFTVPERTIFTVYDLLNNPSFRKKVVGSLNDINLKNFWKYEFGRAGNYQVVKMVSGVTAKVGRFLFSPTARRILENGKSSVNFEEVLDGGKILLCSLPEGELGEDTAQMLGTVVMTKIYQAAQRRVRAKREERRPFYLFVDEFQNFATSAFTRMLSSGRKFGLNVTMAQ